MHQIIMDGFIYLIIFQGNTYSSMLLLSKISK